MTNIELLAKIKAEIERRLECIVTSLDYTAEIELNKLLSFLDTLEEPVCKELDEEIKRYLRDVYDRDTTVRDVAHHFANWQKEKMMGEAVEVIAVAVNFDSATVNIPVSDLKQGDTVKLIIIKEDKK